MEIDLELLRSAVDRMMQYLNELEGTKVVLSQDYYWDIMAPERYSVVETVTVTSIGQISEDWEMVCKVESGELDPIAYNLVHLASILRALGDTGDFRLKQKIQS